MVFFCNKADCKSIYSGDLLKKYFIKADFKTLTEWEQVVR